MLEFLPKTLYFRLPGKVISLHGSLEKTCAISGNSDLYSEKTV